MSDFVQIDAVVKRFAPHLTIGDRIAAHLGARLDRRAVRAVDGVSLSIRRGETLGLVGESGCGKSTLGRMVAGILPPTEGRVLLDQQPVMVNGKKTSTRVQTVFQDPFASLDPRMKVADIISEGPLVHGLIHRQEASAQVAQWLQRVGLEASMGERYPHQFSGGQRQRIAIARALAMQPDVLICDEPVASLDVSIQAQIINLFLQLRRDLNITCLFISHDLSVVGHICDRVAVMYLGKIVESGPTRQVYQHPQHPYTQALLESLPKLVLEEDQLVEFSAIRGEIPSPLNPPSGCYFHPRCPKADEICRGEAPQTRDISGGQTVACHHVG